MTYKRFEDRKSLKTSSFNVKFVFIEDQFFEHNINTFSDQGAIGYNGHDNDCDEKTIHLILKKRKRKQWCGMVHERLCSTTSKILTISVMGFKKNWVYKQISK